ncbi:hypothetical protein RRG08_059775 [Elysia crispata]|uniref:Uncharacterized protein n=1 Tax=Elysia crispata TaxID=231223 RepID=A0AAE1EDV3_9GAST|nr:hypothetical protein RRG08_059775 [Elysia crispata]
MHHLPLTLCVLIVLCFPNAHGQEEFVTEEIFYGIASRAAYLTCAVSSAGEKPTWLYNSSRLGRRAYMDKKGMLVINSLVPEDAEKYTCTTSLGKSTVELVVMEPSAPLDLNLNPLRPTILHVTWTTPVGSPNRITSYNVLIKNLKDDSKSRVQVKDFHASGAQSHLLRGLNPGAVYQIEVFARYGYGIKGKDFDVAGPSAVGLPVQMPLDQTQAPKTAEPPKTGATQYTFLNRRTQLECHGIDDDKDAAWEYVEPQDMSRYQSRYRPNDKILDLFISRTQLEDSGEFSCVSSGGKSTLRLVVLDRQAPRYLRLSAESPTEVKLTWSAPLGSTDHIISYKVRVAKSDNLGDYNIITSQDLSSDGMEKFLLNNLTPGQQYNIEVQAQYPYGIDEAVIDVSGPWSETAQITLPSAPTEAPATSEFPQTANIHYANKDRSVTLRCSGVSKDNVRWQYNKTRLQGRASSRFDQRTNSSNLEISRLQLGDSDDYLCQTRTNESTVKLIVLEPSRPQRLQVRMVPGDRAQVFWLPPSVSSEHIKYYNVHVVLLSMPPTTHSDIQVKKSLPRRWVATVLDDLTLGATYDIQVRAIYPSGEEGTGVEVKGPPAGTRLQVPKPTEKPMTEATSEPTSEPTSELTSEPTTEPTSEPTTEPTSEPTPEPTLEPTTELTTESGTESTPEPETTAELPTLTAEDLKALDVKAYALDSTTIRVSWVINMSSKPSVLLGYKVSLWNIPTNGRERVQKRASVEHPISFSKSAGISTWATEFSNLMPNEKYYMNVKPILISGPEPRARPISLYLKRIGSDQLSINAVALSCNTVLVTYRTVRGLTPDEVRVYQYNDSSTVWDEYTKPFDTVKQYLVVSDLQPETTYFFQVKAKFGNSFEEAITHVTTLSSELLQDLEVKVMPKDGSGIQIDWQKKGNAAESLVYKVTVEQRQPDRSFKQLRCSAYDIVPGDRQGAIFPYVDLMGNNQYQVKVTPYGLAGPGVSSESAPIPEEIDTTENATKEETDETNLHVVVLEVREDQASLTMNVTGERANRLESYRVRVNHVTPRGPHHKEQVVSVDSEDLPLTIKDLKPHRTYEMIVHAIPRGLGRPMKSEKVMIRTSDTCKPANQTEATASPTLYTTDIYSTTPMNSSSNYSTETSFPELFPTNSTETVEMTNTSLEFTSQLPDEMPVISGNNIDLRCSASGYPVPEIHFYKDGKLIAEAQAGIEYVDFIEENITSSFKLQCVAYNYHRIMVKEIEILLQEPENISVDAYAVSMSDTEVVLKWMVTKGDIESISMFVVNLFDDQSKPLGSAFLAKDDRSLPLDSLTPNKRYSAVLRTLVSGPQLVDEDSVQIVPEEPDAKSDAQNGLFLDITEIRDNRARLDMSMTGPFTNDIGKLIVRVYPVIPDGSSSPIQTETLELDKPFLIIENLQPQSLYKVIVMAGLKKLNIPLAMEQIEFNTSAPGMSGPPVLSVLTSDKIGSEEKTENICPEIPTCPPPVDVAQMCNSTAREAEIITTAVPLEVQNVTTVTLGDIQNVTTADVQIITTVAADVQNVTTVTPEDVQNVTTIAPDVQNVTSEPPDVQNVTSVVPEDVQNVTTIAPDVQNVTSEPPDVQNVTSEPPDVQNITTVSSQEEENVTAIENETSAAVTVTSATSIETTAVTSKNKTHTLALRVLRKNPSVYLAWFVENGTLSQVGSFNVKVASETGKTILNYNLSSNSRGLSLQHLKGRDRLFIQLKVMDTNDEDLDQVNIDVIRSEQLKEPEMYLEVNEIRKSTARMIWFAKGVDKDQLRQYRLKVHIGGPNRRAILNQPFGLSTTTTLLRKLKPNSQYYVSVDAEGQDKKAFLHSYLTFKTAERDEAGEPAIWSSPEATTTAPSLAPMGVSTDATSVEMSANATIESQTEASTYDTTEMTMDLSSAATVETSISISSEGITDASLDGSSAATVETSAVSAEGATDIFMDMSSAGSVETSTSISSEGTTDASLDMSSAATVETSAVSTEGATDTSLDMSSAAPVETSASVSTEGATDFSMGMSSAATVEIPSQVTTHGATEMTMEPSSSATVETQTEVSTDGANVYTSGPTVTAAENTTSVPCLPHLAVTITKSSFSRIKFTWNLVGVEHKDVKMLVLTIYEQGIFERTLFWTEDIDLKTGETSIAGLISRKVYAIEFDVLALNKASIIKAESEYLPVAMKDVEHAIASNKSFSSSSNFLGVGRSGNSDDSWTK